MLFIPHRPHRPTSPSLHEHDDMGKVRRKLNVGGGGGQSEGREESGKVSDTHIHTHIHTQRDVVKHAAMPQCRYDVIVMIPEHHNDVVAVRDKTGTHLRQSGKWQHCQGSGNIVRNQHHYFNLVVITSTL